VRTHTREPVPFLLHAPGIGSHALPAFTEAAATSTGLALENGQDLLPFVLSRMGKEDGLSS
jgi:2,3-bisphosphoglycerate-independent phosphoglycerate mutase